MVNLREAPAVITTYSIDGQNKRGEWVRLLRMEIQDGTLYLVPKGNFKSAFTLDLDTFESQLDKPISPHTSISGWAFFDTPEGFAFDTLYRITVRDETGTESTFQLAPPRPGVTQGGGFKTKEARDLSGYTKAMYSDIVGK